jgi:hypothetical protein
MNDRTPWDDRPPLDPPPGDAIRLYIRWQAARERRVELEATLLPVGETVAGGIVMPVRDPRLVKADAAESAAALAFYRHRWWFGAFSKSEAERVIEEAARKYGG